VRYLLQNGAYWGNYPDYSPQAFEALDNNHVDVLRVLLEFGLDYSVSNGKHGDSLFSTAVDNKQREVVELFMEYGANIEESYWCPERGGFGYDRYVATEDEPPVIEIATYAGRVDMVEFFLSVGVDLNGQSAESYLQRARENEPLRLEHEASRNLNSKPKVDLDEKVDVQGVLILVLVHAIIFAVLNWVSNIFYAWRK
jgi:ankyrin repeat protein